MTKWMLFRDSDGEPLSGPLDEEPVPAEGESAVIVALGAGETCDWSPHLRGFVDRAPSLEALRAERERLISRLIEIETVLRGQG